jgi:myo-inositol catabolism protein IolC
MNLGYDRPLYLLPFDHRHSYVAEIFGFEPPLTGPQHDQVCDSKHLIYEGFMLALKGGVPAGTAGVLVDEEFGDDILRDAHRRGFVTALSVERSGAEEFDFEYGADFARHIEDFDPSFAKVLVRYNPDGDRALNRRQSVRLKRLSEYCHRRDRHLLFELLVPPTSRQLEHAGGKRATFDQRTRPALMVEAIRSLQDDGIEPDVWKVEGLGRRDDCERIIDVVQRDGRGEVGCIVLGRGADVAGVRDWLATAASVAGFIGFAVGRTSFWDAVVAYHATTMTRANAAAEIARRLRMWIDIFERQPHARSGT